MDVLTFDIETTVDADRLPLFAEDLAEKVRQDLEYREEPDEPAFRAVRSDLLGATTPEYLRIIGMNLGVGEDAPRSGWVGEVRDGGEPLTERDLLEAFWSLAKQAKHLVGFNSARFDLPAIMVRSALLGVEPSRDLSAAKPWENLHIDLLARRWPYKAGAQFQSLKALRRVLQLPLPNEYADLSPSDALGMLDMTGADVGALWAAGEFEKCRRYGELDIWTTRELCRMFGGYFWPQILERGA